MPTIAFSTNFNPKIRRFISTKGTFISIIMIPTGVLNRMFSTVEIPVAPPITVSEGTRNIFMETAKSREAAMTVKVCDAICADLLWRLDGFGLPPSLFGIVTSSECVFTCVIIITNHSQIVNEFSQIIFRTDFNCNIFKINNINT